MNFLSFLKNNNVILDGGFGTLLQQKGLVAGECPERWNITHPDVVAGIHRDYFSAGSNVVCTNTFGANTLKFSEHELENIIKHAVENARAGKEKSSGSHEKFIALDIGPTGKLLKPYGDLDFEKAVEIFSKTVLLGVKYGVDLILIETFGDSYETKAALLAAKENSVLPVLVSNAYGENGRLVTGASSSAMVALLEGMGADAIGANCSAGPDKLAPVVEELVSCASVPVILKPNAGLPEYKDGKTVYGVNPQEFALQVSALVQKGVRVAGGCCGTTPEHIAALAFAVKDYTPVPVTEKNITCISSYSRSVVFGDRPLLIGERINPTGKKRFKQALVEKDVDYILREGISQQQNGADVLDVNVGIPDIDEAEMLATAVRELQTVTDLPLQIDTASPDAMERTMRLYNGKPMVNSVNGKAESMQAVFPLVKKYGGLVVALTLDENGIPATAEERIKIALNIVKTAESYGIHRKNIIIDPLAMTIAADNTSAATTLKAVYELAHTHGLKTLLGVSNVSFGLPERDNITAAFFTLALENGLSAAIMNPFSYRMMSAFRAFSAIKGWDANCGDYIAYASTHTSETFTPVSAVAAEASISDLGDTIVKGLKETASQATLRLLKTEKPLDIINGHVIPALNKVGTDYGEKRLFLPQLLMSAECAQIAFEHIKSAMSLSDTGTKCPFVIATVKGDIHDIGKNIVKLLLSSYGFAVTDLGKDVPPEQILHAVLETKAPLAGLSALMTTTVPAMAETVKLLHEKAPFCSVVVGGAVLNEEYAKQIGADFYAPDAMDTVYYAETVYSKLK